MGKLYNGKDEPEKHLLRQQKYRRTKKGIITSIYGRQRSSSKKRGDPMPTYTKEGIFIKEFHSAIEAYRETGARFSHILDCARNKKGFKTAGGFKWKIAS